MEVEGDTEEVEEATVVEEEDMAAAEEDTVVAEVNMAATLAVMAVVDTAVTEVGLRTQQPPKPSLNMADTPGDRMGNLGAGLQDINWSNTQLTKFEKK